MKRILFIAVVATAFSFNAKAQATFGLQIGGNLGFAQVEDGSEDDISNKPRIGILAGFVGDIPFGSVSFRPEINFIQKGFRNEETLSEFGTTTVFNSKVRLNYVEVPLNFVYNLQTGSGSKVFFGLGPNFALGLSGKTESEIATTIGGTTINTKEDGDVKFSGDENAANTTYLKRFDFGGNILAGFQSSMGLTFNVGFTLGLSDISRNQPGTDNYTQKNHGLTFKVGYMFGGSKSKPASSSSSSTSANF